MAQDITDLMTLSSVISEELIMLDEATEAARVQSFRAALRSVVQDLLAQGRNPTATAVRDRLIELGHTDWDSETSVSPLVSIR